jgi:hypothetical protein
MKIKRKTASYYIDEKVLKAFDEKCDKLCISKSKWIEERMKEFIEPQKPLEVNLEGLVSTDSKDGSEWLKSALKSIRVESM